MKDIIKKVVLDAQSKLNEVVSDDGIAAHKKAGHRVKVHPDGKSYTWYDDEKRIGRKVTSKGQMSVKYSTKSGRDEDEVDESLSFNDKLNLIKEQGIDGLTQIIMMEDPDTDKWWNETRKANEFWKKKKEREDAEKGGPKAPEVKEEVIPEETQIEEGRMGELHMEVGDHLDKHIAAHKSGSMGADTLGDHTVRVAKKLAKQHGMEHKHMQKMVNDYVDSALKESYEPLKEGLPGTYYAPTSARKKKKTLKDLRKKDNKKDKGTK